MSFIHSFIHSNSYAPTRAKHCSRPGGNNCRPQRQGSNFHQASFLTGEAGKKQMEQIGRKNRGSREKGRGARRRALSSGDRKSAAKMESPSECSPGHAERLSSSQRERAHLLQSDPCPVREIAPPLSGHGFPCLTTELFSIPCESSSNSVRQAGSRYNYLYFVAWAGRQNFPNSLEDPQGMVEMGGGLKSQLPVGLSSVGECPLLTRLAPQWLCHFLLGYY